jgi:hypothetical protein
VFANWDSSNSSEHLEGLKVENEMMAMGWESRGGDTTLSSE